MKSTFNHLPQAKQEELEIIRETILELGKPVMVIKLRGLVEKVCKQD